MPLCGPFDLIVADPPYKTTSLAWDKALVTDWLAPAARSLRPSGSLWLFGSMRSLMTLAGDFAEAGLRYAQDVVWEKHNGSSPTKDRFRRVHEHVIQFYNVTAPWVGVYNNVQVTMDATKRTVQRKKRPPHFGPINQSAYESHDGGPRLMRSVLRVRSCHGRAIHPTEKPVDLLRILVRTSCPPGGVVGDWFAGSAALAEACRLEGRDYIGCESNPEYFAKAARRITA